MAEEKDNLFPTAVNDTLVGKVNDIVEKKEEKTPIMPEGDDIPIIEADEPPKTPEKSASQSGKSSKRTSQRQTPTSSALQSQKSSPRGEKSFDEKDEKKNSATESPQSVKSESSVSNSPQSPQSPHSSSKDGSEVEKSPKTPNKELSENEADNEDSPNDKEQRSHESSLINEDTNTLDSLADSQEIHDSWTHHNSEDENQRMQTAPVKTRRKPPPKVLTYLQEQQRIPEEIRNNPYVAIRTNTYPVKKTRPPRAAKSSAAEYRTRRAVHVDDYTQALLDGQEPEEEPTLEQLKSTAFQLRHIERDLIDKSDYAAAKNANKCFNYVTEKLKRDTHFHNSRAAIQELIAKRNELNALIEHIEADYDQRIDAHNDVTYDKELQMRQQFDEEIDQFDENKPTELEPLFKRNSVTYFKMRSEEKNLALNKKFDEAIKKKKQADQLAILEEQQAYEKQEDHYREKKVRLIEHQQRTLNHFHQYANGRLLELQAAKAKTVDPMKHRVNNINRLIEKMCEKRGIKPQQLDFDHVDNDRVEMLKTKEKQGQIPTRPATSTSRPASSASKQPTIKKPKVSKA